MSEKKPPEETQLNPELHATRDESYGPDQQGQDPMQTVSVTPQKRRLWPLVWAIVTVACLLITLYLLIP